MDFILIHFIGAARMGESNMFILVLKAQQMELLRSLSYQSKQSVVRTFHIK